MYDFCGSFGVCSSCPSHRLMLSVLLGSFSYEHFGVLILVSISEWFGLCLSFPCPHGPFTAPAVHVLFGLGRFVPLPCTAWVFPMPRPGLSRIGIIHVSLHVCCGWVVPCIPCGLASLSHAVFLASLMVPYAGLPFPGLSSWSLVWYCSLGQVFMSL